MIKILNICLHQNSIFIKFFKILKIHEIFCENPRIIFFFYDVHKENMFTINLEEASKDKFCIIWIGFKIVFFCVGGGVDSENSEHV